MEIESINDSDPTNPTFTVEVHGIERSVGAYEGVSKTVQMNKKQLEVFGKL
jgi:hypothetical protein